VLPDRLAHGSPASDRVPVDVGHDR
jgi:hypothetical protein